MYTINKHRYEPPMVVKTTSVLLERGILFGSIVDWIHPVETAGQEVDQFVDYSFTTDSDFNHKWVE